MKPEWCPQWATDEAARVYHSLENSHVLNEDAIARALLEAHQRGRREGMEEAAAYLIRLGKGTPLGHENISLGRSTYNWMSHCAAFIRAKAQEVDQ